MATYVATNVQNFPDPNPDFNTRLLVRATLSSSVVDGGAMISAWSGVAATFAEAVDTSRSASGSDTTTTVAGPGAIPVRAGGLAYAVTMSNGVVGLAGPAGFTNVTTMGDASMKADGEYAAQATAGSVDPRWTWFFNSPGSPRTWLATVLALNQAGQVQPQAAATQLAFTVQPSNATAGSTISPPVQVAARDGAGNTDATFSGTITVALGTNPSGGTLSGTRSVAAVNGVASFSNLSIDRAGSGYTLTATATGLTGATSASFTITAPPPPPPPPAGGIVWDTMSSALGQHNNFFIKGFNPRSPRPGDAIVVTVFWVGSGANIVDSVTDHLARPDFPPVGNRYHLVEYVSSDNISMATYVATNVQGYPYPTAPNVDVLAVRANLSRVAFGGIMMAAWSGVAGDFAQAVDTSMSRSGFGAASAEALVGPGAMPVNAGALAYAVTASRAQASRFPPQGFGNLLTMGVAPPDSFSMQTEADSAVQASGGSVNPQWRWFFQNDPTCTTTTPCTWLASVLALNPGAAPPPPPPPPPPPTVDAAQSGVVASPTTITAGSGTSTITVTARDASGNPVSGVNVVLSATGSGNTLTQPAGPTNASGVATGMLSSTVAGTKTVSATAGGVAITQTAAVTVTAGGVSASQSTVTASPTSITAGSGTSTITVTARDANGNPVSGATVTLSA
ncbi:MAG: hypothetical protein DMD59_14705, partial [Gemmatimonadetes bacterium]